MLHVLFFIAILVFLYDCNDDSKNFLNNILVEKKSFLTATSYIKDMKEIDKLNSIEMITNTSGIQTSADSSTTNTNMEKNAASSNSLSKPIGGNGVVNAKYALCSCIKLSTITHL